MSLSALFGYSLLISGPALLVLFVLRGMFPRKTDHDPMSEPFGEMPNDGRRG